MNFYTIREMLREKVESVSFFLLIPIAHAQTFGLITPSGPQINFTDRTFLLILLRYALVIALLIVGFQGCKAGYDWFYHEGDATRRTHGQEQVSRAFIIASILFFLLLLYHVFVPDFRQLSI